MNYKPSSLGLLHSLEPWLNDDDVTEICLNQPGEVFIEKQHTFQRIEAPKLNACLLADCFQLLARENHQLINQQRPLLSGILPNGLRIQCVLPPVSRSPIFAIRKPSIIERDLQDYSSCLSQITPYVMHDGRPTQTPSAKNQQLHQLFQKGQWLAFLFAAIEQRKNMIISGGTSTGKTTFLNACLKHIPMDERIITLEDTPELRIKQPNHLRLLTAPDANIGMQELVQSALRLRPDRIIMGEIRGKECFDFVAASNTGHQGTITSIHANNPHAAIMRMTQLYKLNHVPSMTDTDIRQELHQVIDIIVQLGRNQQGRFISDIYYKEANTTANAVASQHGIRIPSYANA